MARYSTVFFDFGGVLAEEGFREGLKAIGRHCGRDPDEIYQCGKELVYESGYVVGACSEASYWQAFRHRTGIIQSDQELRYEILSRFELRPEMFSAVRKLDERGYRTAILSDQTNWLDELDRLHRIFSGFEHVFNSYHVGLSKKEPRLFEQVIDELGIRPQESVFLDDDPGNIERAQDQGIKGVLVEESRSALRELSRMLDEDLTQSDILPG